MENKSEFFALMSSSIFDLKSLESILYKNGYLPYTRSCAYPFAKRLRKQYPNVFIRVLKVDGSYFIITDEDEYKDYWEFRKIALRNERKKNNETLQYL